MAIAERPSHTQTSWQQELDNKRDELQFQEPQWGPVGREAYERTYARPDANGKAETWIETCYRVVKGNLSLVDAKHIEAGEAAALLDNLFNFRSIPAGRHLWVSGVPGRQFLFNCHRAGFTERFSRHFEFTFNELMKGGGVGANYSNDYISQYPPIANTVKARCYIAPEYDEDDVKMLVARSLIEVGSDGLPVYPPPHYTEGYMRVQDSREGWFNALNRLLEGFYNGGDHFMNFDLSMLRPKGSIIKGFGGIASGPWALAKLLQDVSNFLNTKKGQKLTSVDFMEIDHLIAACVVAGNIRRSARMAIKHWKDEDIFDFINCKHDPQKHWSTNISVEIDSEFWATLDLQDDEVLSQHAVKVLNRIVEGMMVNGEPGFVNTSLAGEGERGDIRSTNPCGEIFLEDFENCNLGHVNLGAFWDKPIAAREAFRLMQRYLLRATFGDITDPAQRAVVDRNRRTGVGIFGFQAWLVKQGVRFSESWENEQVRMELASFKEVCIAEATVYSQELGIPEPIKHTTVAPTGTIAKLPGTTEGIHPVFARYFYRRIRYGANDPKLQRFYAEGYQVEEDLYSEDTKVVTFPVKDIIVEEVAKMGYSEFLVEDASEISLEDMMRVQRMIQETYADNSIAFTMNFKPNRYSFTQFRDAVEKYGRYLKGTTAMPDMSRPQMPYERITSEEFEATGIGKVGQGEMDCVTGSCPVK